MENDLKSDGNVVYMSMYIRRKFFVNEIFENMIFIFLKNFNRN